MEDKFSSKEIDDFYIRVGKRVKEEREKKSLTQLQLSYLMGYKSVSLLSAAELYTNKKHFNLEHLYKISIILNITLDELFKDL
ncbi:MAG: helix-turn-helix transcriptional regulator [Aliarcobacter sp.]|nr:helix-turn-helix transcriptional regulator [Aliarcobacter sp.]